MATIYSGSDAGKSGLEMVELDGSPDVRGVSKINVSNATLTDDGNGEVTLITGGGGGGSGTVTSVAMDGGTTGLTYTGSPITTSGTITLGGTLGSANGGTGQDLSGNTGFVKVTSGTFFSQLTINASTEIAGTLALSNGGTGATSASDARTNLGLGSTDNVTFNNVEIDGNLNHDGSNIGFFGTTPTTEETVDGPFTQGFNPGSATPNESALAAAIDSLAAALEAYGLITYNP